MSELIPDYPDMPRDWWPDNLTLAAKHDGVELGVQLMPTTGHLDKDFRASIMGLRLSLWMMLHARLRPHSD